MSSAWTASRSGTSRSVRVASCPVPFLGDAVALVGDAVAVIGHALTRVSGPLALVGKDF